MLLKPIMFFLVCYEYPTKKVKAVRYNFRFFFRVSRRVFDATAAKIEIRKKFGYLGGLTFRPLNLFSLKRRRARRDLRPWKNICWL